MRAAPHKNRFYQQKKAAMEERYSYQQKRQARASRERALRTQITEFANMATAQAEDISP